MTDTCVSMYQAPHNESAWSYVRGVMGSYPPTDFPKLIEAVEEYCQREKPPAQCLELMADVLVQGGTAEGKQQACAIFERLATDRHYSLTLLEVPQGGALCAGLSTLTPAWLRFCFAWDNLSAK